MQLSTKYTSERKSSLGHAHLLQFGFELRVVLIAHSLRECRSHILRFLLDVCRIARHCTKYHGRARDRARYMRRVSQKRHEPLTHCWRDKLLCAQVLSWKRWVYSHKIFCGEHVHSWVCARCVCACIWLPSRVMGQREDPPARAHACL